MLGKSFLSAYYRSIKTYANLFHSPGRFFVSHELKMVFAFMLLHYDFKPLMEKPKKMWVIRFNIPGPVNIELKRRKSIWTPTAA